MPHVVVRVAEAVAEAGARSRIFCRVCWVATCSAIRTRRLSRPPGKGGEQERVPPQRSRRELVLLLPMLRAGLGDSLTGATSRSTTAGRRVGAPTARQLPARPRVAAPANAAGAEQPPRQRPLAAGGGAQLWRGGAANFDGRNVYGRSAQFDAALARRPRVALLLLEPTTRAPTRAPTPCNRIVRLAARLRKLPSRPALALLLPPRVLYNETFSGLSPALWSGDARSSCCPRCAAPREPTPAPASALCTKSSFRLWDTSEALPDDPSLYVGDGIPRAQRVRSGWRRRWPRSCAIACACASIRARAPNNIMPLGSSVRAARATYCARRRRAEEARRAPDRRGRTPAASEVAQPGGQARARRRGGASSSAARWVAEGRSRSEDDGWRSTPQ